MKPTPAEAPPVPWRINGRALGRSLSMCLVALIGWWGFLVRAENRSSSLARARWLSRTCVRVLRVLKVRLVVTGTPAQGVMLTPNHVSYLDVLVLAALAPTTFVAKAEVARWPLFGWFARAAGTLFIQREKKSDLMRVGKRLAPVLAQGVNLAVFLEGTSSDGKAVRTFRPGLLQPIVQLQAKAVPVAISYRVPPPREPSRDVAWWGRMPLIPHLAGMLGVPWIEARVHFGEACGPAEERKPFAAELQAAVEIGLQGLSRS